MNSHFRFSLTFAILASLAALLLLTWLLLSIISFKTAEKDLLSEKSASASAIVKLLASGFSGSQGPGFLERTAKALGSVPEFAGLTVVNDRLEPLYTLSDNNPVDSMLQETVRKPAQRIKLSANGSYVFAYAPMITEGSVTGALRLSLSLAGEHARLARSRTLFLGYFILDFTLLLGLGAFVLRRIVVSPLERLLTATERVIAGNYSHPVHLHGSREIAGLADSFNLMQQGLKDRREEVELHLRSLEAANRALKEARLETIRSEKMASVGLLAAGMAHEIGAPLAGIIGYSGILADELASDPEKSDYLRRISVDAGRIDQLVRDLLNYARPVKPEIEKVEVREFLEDLFAMLERQGIFKRIDARLLAGEGLATLYIDRHQLLQVMMNLVINARDAMPDGGSIVISALPGAGESVIISVQDNGEGVSPDNIEKIFEPFFTTKEPGRGTGLGLAISARLAESFGGVLKVVSELGHGATFSLTLPGVKNES